MLMVRTQPNDALLPCLARHASHSAPEAPLGESQPVPHLRHEQATGVQATELRQLGQWLDCLRVMMLHWVPSIPHDPVHLFHQVVHQVVYSLRFTPSFRVGRRCTCTCTCLGGGVH